MKEGDRLRAENQMLRARLSGLTEAILRISDNLDLDIVLQEIVDSARSLSDARYGAITTLDESGELQDLLISGMTPEEKAGAPGAAAGSDPLQIPDRVRGDVEDR